MSTPRDLRRPLPPGWIEIRSSRGKLLARYHPGDDRPWLREGSDEEFVNLHELRGGERRQGSERWLSLLCTAVAM
jgi:hypothetical protein